MDAGGVCCVIRLGFKRQNSSYARQALAKLNTHETTKFGGDRTDSFLSYRDQLCRNQHKQLWHGGIALANKSMDLTPDSVLLQSS